MQGAVVERDTDVRVLSAQAFRGDDPLPALASLDVADIGKP
jgi:hypothetical protein